MKSEPTLHNGQEFGRGGNKLSVNPARFIGISITVGMILAFYLYTRTDRGVEAPALGELGSGVASTAAPRRGGQLVASIRGEPRSFNRLVARDQTTELLSILTQGRLVRIHKSTFELEPWLAERWDSAPDGRTHTLFLRQGVTWSDGAPFTAADVLFTLQAVFDPKVNSILASSMAVAGQPIAATAPDAQTVVLTFAGPSGPGLRLLDGLPILPKHKLEAALAAGTLAMAWDSKTPPADLVGLGPFVLREYLPGQRVVLDRNPRYWRKSSSGEALPLLDRVVLEITPDQNAELLRLQAGDIDLTSSELRPEDYVPVSRGQTEGKLTLLELGVGPDADAFWFCLKPEVKRADPRFAFVQRPEFRQAISHAVDREAFADTVFLSAAVPVWGPITPGNRPWFSPNLPRYQPNDATAVELLKKIGLEDRDKNGVVEDARGTEARFTVLTQSGIGWYERGTATLRDELARVGIALEIAPLEIGTLIQRMLACDYDAIYYRPLASDLDPAGNMDFWLSSGSAHFWNLEQRTPATEWEQRIDTLMREQAAMLDPEQRRQQFNAVQRIFAENLPVLYFVAPRLYYGHTRRVTGIVPSVIRPPVLWNADSLGVTQ